MKRILLLLLVCLSGTLAMAQTTWTGLGANTNWNNTDNWDTNLVPTASDDVIIPDGFTVTLNVTGNVKSIDLQGTSTFEINTNFTFNEPSTLGLNTTVNWASGTLNGGSVLTNNGTINSTTGANHIITGGTVVNNLGSFNLTSGGDLFVSSTGTELNNLVGGIIDIQEDAANITWSGAAGIINNEGSFKKSTSLGEVQILVPFFNNDGTIQVEEGILSFTSAVKTFTDGTYNVFAGATMDWDITINVLGTLTGTLAGDLNWNNTVNVAAGETAIFNFTNPNNFNWANGSLNGGGTLTNLGTINSTTNANHFISGGSTLNNQGTFNLTSGGDLFISGAGSTLNNQAGGTIDIQEDAANITWSGIAGVLNNEGLLKKTTSSGEAQVQIPVNNNDGTIQVEEGILSLITAPKNFTDGTYNVFSGATLDWDVAITVLGTLSGAVTGNLNWNSTVTVADGTFAAFNFSVADNFNWTTGTLNGGGTLTNNNVLNLTTGGNHFISAATTLDNEGTINITSAGDLIMSGSDTELNNLESGIIDMQADFGNIQWSSSPGVINNTGLIKKTTSSGEAQIFVTLNNNDGTIQAEAGILSFQSAEKNFTAGTYNVFAGATMDWDTTINVSGSITGTVAGNLNWTSILNVVDGAPAALNFSESDNFNWTTGSLTGGGTLTNNNVLNLTTGGNHFITGDTTLDNNGTINITSGGDLFLSGAGVSLNNTVTGIIDMQADFGNISWSSAQGVLNNEGLLRRSTTTGIAQILAILNNSGTIEVVTGELEITGSSPFTNLESGIVKGVGIFDLPPVASYTNNGTFAPGLSPGTLFVQGTFESTSTSVLDIEINGLTPDTEHDVLAITGTNDIFEGTVNVTMGFEGTIGDAFTIATTTGTIATANLQSPIENVDFDGKRYTFDVTYPDNNKVVLTITDKLDIQVPDVLTQNITIQLDASGNASITEAQIDNGSTDNCTLTPNLIFSLDITDFTCADLGDNTVTLTVTDEATNAANATAIVTVEDSILPTVVTQNVTVQLDASGNALITTGDIDDGSSDNCTVSSLSLDVSSFTCADLGANTVNLTVTDQSGNSDSASGIVTVEDSILPTVVTQNITVQLDASGNASITTGDIDDGSSDNCTVSSLSLDVSSFTCADLGANTVILTVTDQSGNSASSPATVTVEDTIFPLITCPGAGGFTVFNAGAYTLPDYVGEAIVAVEDNCSFDVLQTPLPGTVLPDGDYTIFLVVTDTSGNESTCDFELKVRDTTLSVDDQQLLDSDILLFPNPVVDNFTVQNNSRLNLIDLQIIDVTGKIINRVNLKQMRQTIEIPIDNYANGIYFVKINALNSSITKQIIKQ